MNMKNSQIRARSRHLLDDNIFGKDWLKGAFVFMLMSLISTMLSELLNGLALSVSTLLLTLTADLESKILGYLILGLVYGAAAIIFFGIAGPLNVGVAAVYVDFVRRDQKISIGKFFYGFRNFAANIILGIMYTLQIALWSLFFVIPGIYIAYSYALVFHVKRDHPDYRWKQCFDESERLMEGNRWRLFKLQFGHIGWFIIGLAFVGIGAFWAYPYLETSMAIFYEEVRFERGKK